MDDPVSEANVQTDGEDDAEHQPEKMEQDFWRLHQRLNVPHGNPPSYPEACEYLGIEEDEPCLPAPDFLKNLMGHRGQAHQLRKLPQQVVGIAHMIIQELGPIQGRIIADDCGLGKTIQTLSFIVFRSLKLPSAYENHQPTIIAMPPSCLDTWLMESSRYFTNHLDIILCHRQVGGDLLRQGLNVSPDKSLPTGPWLPGTSSSSSISWASRCCS
jgi:SNF2 family DNA or RNA helicase